MGGRGHGCVVMVMMESRLMVNTVLTVMTSHVGPSVHSVVTSS